MSAPIAHLPVRPSIEQLQKQAKDLLRQYRAGETVALERFRAANRTCRALADAQFLLAHEFGFESWASLKRHVEERLPSRRAFYDQLADDVVRACEGRDAAVLDRLGEQFGGKMTPGEVRSGVLSRLGRAVDDAAPVTLEDARRFVARRYGFESWSAFSASLAEGPSRSGALYQLDPGKRTLVTNGPLSSSGWEEIFEVLRHHRICRLRAHGQMTDAVLGRLAALDVVTSLEIQGSKRVTDAGLRSLARMPWLEGLDLTGCSITDEGLTVLRHLPALREFSLYHHQGISDEGLANLGHCENIERVNLLGARSGDGVLRTLAGKAKLRHLKSGDQVTDAGLQLLQQLPVFRTWQGGQAEIELMRFDAEPNYLLLRGALSDAGMASLGRLEGLFALNLDDSRLAISAEGLRPLAGLPHLEWLGFDATNETMGEIGAMPQLRMLMCQDTRAGDEGFRALSRSRTLQYIWGRRCYNLGGRGFRALARMPALRGLSVSCRNVDDASLASLPDFPTLTDFMPMDFVDEGFRHVGRCGQLEQLWCMYCRETGDAATEYLASLSQLKGYYAGYTRITDRSLEVLAAMQSLERLGFEGCAAVTNAGVQRLGGLPRLRELKLSLMPGVTREAIRGLPAHVEVQFEP